MAQLRTEVQKEIKRLRNSVSQRISELDSLRAELAKLVKVQEMLGDGKPRRVRKAVTRRPRRRRRQVDWNAVLNALPATFSVRQLNKAPHAKGKSGVYLRQIVARWAKERKIKRVARGKYQKA